MAKKHWFRRARECTHCTKPRAEGRTMCEPCLKAAREHKRYVYHRRKRAGQCAVCGMRIVTGSWCAECKERHNASTRKSRAKRRGYGRKYQQARSDDRYARGLCVACGKAERTEPHKMCPVCRAKMHLSFERSARRKRSKEQGT